MHVSFALHFDKKNKPIQSKCSKHGYFLFFSSFVHIFSSFNVHATTCWCIKQLRPPTAIVMPVLIVCKKHYQHLVPSCPTQITSGFCLDNDTRRLHTEGRPLQTDRAIICLSSRIHYSRMRQTTFSFRPLLQRTWKKYALSFFQSGLKLMVRKKNEIGNWKKHSSKCVIFSRCVGKDRI